MQKKGGRNRQRFCPPASREGNDHELFNVINGEAISIHASRRGSDDYTDEELKAHKKFQSTLPAGEATYMPELRLAEHIFQSTLPAREATRLQVLNMIDAKFQSTLPAREATQRP